MKDEITRNGITIDPSTATPAELEFFERVTKGGRGRKPGTLMGKFLWIVGVPVTAVFMFVIYPMLTADKVNRVAVSQVPFQVATVSCPSDIATVTIPYVETHSAAADYTIHFEAAVRNGRTFQWSSVYPASTVSSDLASKHPIGATSTGDLNLYVGEYGIAVLYVKDNLGKLVGNCVFVVQPKAPSAST